MDMEAVKKSVQKIQQLGYFKIERGAPVRRPRRGEEGRHHRSRGRRPRRNEIQFGAGYSGFDGFFGQFSFQTRNFLGRGEIIGASAQLGKVSNFFDLSYTIPWFMDKNQSVGASLFRRNVNYLVAGRAAAGRLGLLRQGHRPLRLGLAAVLLRGHHGELPGPQRADPARDSRRRRRSSPRRPERRRRSRRPTATTAATTRSIRRGASGCSAAVQIAPALLRRHELVHQADRSARTIYIPVRIPRNALLAFNVEVGYVRRVQRQPSSRSSSASSSAASRACAGSSRAPSCRVQPDDLRGLHRRARPHPRRQQVLRHQRRVPVPARSARRSCSPSSTSATTTTTRRASASTTSGPRPARSCGSSCRSSRRPCGSSTPSTCTRSSRSTSSASRSDYLTEKKSGFTFSIGRTF